MTLSPFSAMRQVTHPHASSGPRMETVQFCIAEKLLSLKILQEISMDGKSNAPQRTA